MPVAREYSRWRQESRWKRERIVMAITSVVRWRVGPSTWLVEAVSDVVGALFYWYLGDELLEVSARSARQFSVGIGESAVVHVFDDAVSVPGDGLSGRLALSWDAVVGARAYVVQEWDGDAWVTRVTLRAGVETYFRWRTGVLSDVTVAQWRVLGVGENEAEGTACAVSVLVVRVPGVRSEGFGVEDGVLVIG